MSQKSECKRFTNEKLARLESLPANATSAALAQLRRGLSSLPGQIPGLWEWTINGLPEELMGKQGEATKVEWAVHAVLTLYAFHQQGNDIKIHNMHLPGRRFGSAVRLMTVGEDEGADERISKRLKVTASTDSISALTFQLRQMVSLLKTKSIAFDYVDLAGDLYDYQYEESRSDVRRKWAQDYYRIEKNTSNEE